jgi:2-polyprenyl-6-methoxyphenol hydroxylase-like FAD-dependent oxidoreductase
VVRPHVGAGIVKAMTDAAVLATALDENDDVPAGLHAFEARRIGKGRNHVAQARRLGFLSPNAQAPRSTPIPTACALLDFLHASQPAG